jgi:gliding motility-associated-like protein
MQQGHTYALLVDNFSNGNNGFKLEFGGTGEFKGPIPKINLSKNQPCTVNQNFTFTSNGSANYTRVQWFFGDGASIASSTDPNPPAISYSSPGFKTAVLQVFNGDGCSVGITESFLVGLKPDLPLINGLKPRYCIGENILLNTPLQANASYSWTGPNGFTSSLQEINITIDDANKAGIYTLSVTINGCTSDTRSVTVPLIGQTPIASFISSSTKACTPQQTFTFTNSSQNFAKLRWNFGEGASILPGNSNPINTITYSSSGVKTIILEAEGNSGCISIFSQDLIVALSPDRPIISVNKPDFCLTDTIRLSTPPQTDVVYRWTGPNNFISDQRAPQIAVTSPLVAGTYSVTISRGNCSTETISMVVPPIYQNPTAAFRAEPRIPSKLAIPIKVNFFNESKDANAYLWDFGDGNTSTDTNPEHIYTSVGNFDVTLTVFKSSVCSASIVKGQFMISADNILFVPNTFTPNNDGVNDEFVISITNIKTYRIQIFNRFGVPLFLSNDIFDHWKGFYKNEILPVGTYYYVIDATDFNSNIIKKSGSVTIIK